MSANKQPEPATFVSIAHSEFQDRGIDFMAALNAVMTCERYSAEHLAPEERRAALAWFKAKYLTP